MTGAELREKFLHYFEQRGHARVQSSSLVPSGDATLLFVNAGMVQFKSVFTGAETRAYKRATTAQKCLRVSGKHNDLENVGHTARHHTFFEMLGNFSFGDYFKEDAIAFAWEFLTRDVGLPKKDLHVTIYKDDDEAELIWKKILGPGSNPIIRLGEKDNFWSMGDTGPCGPCSEIHIDQGDRLACGDPQCGPECECDRFLELWNLVFMQYDRDASGKMSPLPRPSIDTGLGLERLAAVVQGVDSNWESDLFRPIIHYVEELSGKECRGNDRDSIAIRVIADHSRAAAFLISDGIFPSNEGRGYVLRRILRRALRYGKYIGLNEPFLYSSADVVVNLMSDAYPELESSRSLISKVIRNEENRFLETLARGLLLFEEEAGKVLSGSSRVLSGQVAFRLYDTFGFPPDLTGDLAKEAGLTVDQAGFDTEMTKQREMARQSWEGMAGEDLAALREILEEGITTEFTGYETLEDEAAVSAIIKEGRRVQEAGPGEHVEIIAERTPFYGESGGQVGDHGTIVSDAAQFDVMDTTRPFPNLIVHKGLVTSGTVKVGDRTTLKVNTGMRRSIMANHSATHLLQWALREVLGDHVKQSGSLVEGQRLRFDFTHFSAITSEELKRIEELVNDKIQENLEVKVELQPIEEAMKRGATALFGEKYSDTVRVVSMGDFSMELCGGTHARRTGDMGLFKILTEGGIASGVRRIEAVTGKGALNYVRSMEEEIRSISEKLKTSRGELAKKIDKLLEEKKSKEREAELLKTKLAGKQTSDILEGVRDVGGVKVLVRLIEDVATPKDLRDYADRVKDRLGSGIALLGAKADGKALLLAVVTKDLTNRFHAGNIVKKAAEAVGGSGGGRPDMAQAGGPNVAELPQALKSIEDFL
ncbi:alanine--tRNA ligase [Desulfomonile tiedjei]|uniref:Alanine--tRNA ligase n=1 Tax=Desulfomonile tiedjei (strain ATCC 49306 / DSM 6799 / DCB-1) TaxID=706587 RepID=I4C6N4_DESTA|nr:alanine--tRNA ligase [Desulfomonile tiedjei]AFM25225.1 alanyl-tRNA synthetase [Desulfomonile tiedjei DSM 6799]